ncbi:MAG: hypothetical protein FJ135_07185 [Deltaproteobacteria bacterium]|nr:hypothetical protein [Deltaproteobacteria bacterium]
MKPDLNRFYEKSKRYNLAHILEKIIAHLSIWEKEMGKRNKKTTRISRLELCGLTEQILAGMGEEGKIIRDRLVRFFGERTIPPGGVLGKAPSDASVDVP